MTARQFDPVFSAALRNELEALADGHEAGPVGRPQRVRVLLHRPQLWVSLLTAVVLVAATIGVFRLTGAPPQPASTPAVVDPLSEVTTPGTSNYVARSVRTLLTVRGTGTGTHDLDVPAGVTSVRTYLDCAPSGPQSVDIGPDGGSSGDCDRTPGGSFDTPITAGTHEVTVRVRAGTRYALAIIVSPAPTVATGPLIDPFAQVRDPRDPDALLGDTRPLLRLSGRQGTTAPVALTVPDGVQRVRVFLVCRPAAATTSVRIGGHLVTGCQNAIAHWFDFSPASRSLTAAVTAPGRGDWSLLVVPAPPGAKDSPANQVLPYPATGHGPVLVRTRGTGARTTGTYVSRTDTILVTATCRGTGWLEIATGGGTSGRGDDCGRAGRFTVGFGGDGSEVGKRLPWSVTPHGDVSWTVQIQDDGS